MTLRNLPLLLSLSIFSGISVFAQPQDTVEVGKRILEQYYQRCNTVMAYSTRQERSNISRRLIDGAGPSYPLDARLKEILKHLRWIKSRTEEIDPGIISGSVPADLITINGFFMIEDFEEKNGVITVRLKVYHPDDDELFGLVKNFSDINSEDMVPPSEDKIVAMSRNKAPSTELHTWVRLGDTWYKRAMNAILLFPAGKSI